MVHLVVRQIDGSSFGVTVGADATVTELLQLIASASDEQASALRLIHGGQLLLGSMRLSDHAICDSTALTLLKEGGTSIRAPSRPIGAPVAVEAPSRPALGDGRSKGAQIAPADLGAGRVHPVPAAVSVLWIDGGVITVNVPAGAATTVEQLKGAVVRASGVASLAPAQLALLYAGAALGDAQLLSDLPLADGRGAALLHAVPVEVPLGEQFGWPARGAPPSSASGAAPCLRAHCPDCGVAGAAWDLALTCPLCADDHEAVLVLAGTTPADAALQQISLGDEYAGPPAPYSYADVLALVVRCFKCGAQGMPRVGFRCRACVIPVEAVAASGAAARQVLSTAAAAAAGSGTVRWLGVPDSRALASAAGGLDGSVASAVPAGAVSTVFSAVRGGGGAWAVSAAVAPVGGAERLELVGDAGSWLCSAGAGVPLAPSAPSAALRSAASAAALLPLLTPTAAAAAAAGLSDIPSKGGRVSPAAGTAAATAAASADAADEEPLPPLPAEGGEGAGVLADRDPADFSGTVVSLPDDIGGQAPQRRLLARTALGPDQPSAAAALGAALLAALGRPHAGALQARY